MGYPFFPVLLTLGEYDKTGKVPQYNWAWAAKTGYPLKIIPGAGHNANVDNPVVFNAVVEDFLAVKRIFDENTLGRVFNIESRVHGSRGVPGDWRNKKRQGGGMILDWGVHLLDQMLLMLREDVVSTYCTVSHVTNDEVDDGFKAILTFASGLTAHVEVGTSNFIELPRWYMQGENGTAIIRDWALNGEIVMVSDWEKRDAVPVVTAAGLTKTMAPRTEETIKRFPLPKVTSDVRDFYRNVMKAIKGEEDQLVTHTQLMRVMRLMEAMTLSAQRNETVHSRI
ncbi:MAG: hypothetical protein EOM58_09435 [Clostridia bacterium]|nr:hypothetical protein [Clostridia bacterium]